MSLNHVILGLLNREPMTGYEIKKIMQHTPFMHWSGNNNQIYKAFSELLAEGLVAKEVHHQEGAPSKHIYSITGDGLNELRNWLFSVPDAPFFKKEMLVKLALIPPSRREDLQHMLASYADVVKMQAELSERELDRGYFAERSSADNPGFLDLIRENIRSFYSGELEWINKVQQYVEGLPVGERESLSREDAAHQPNEKAGLLMNVQVLNHQGNKYLYIKNGQFLFLKEQDVIEIISLCFEHDANAVVLEGAVFSDDFIRLQTGLAGTVLQKLTNYNIRAAVVIQDGQEYPERFREMVSEYRTGTTFRIFANPEEAVAWLFP